MSNFAPSKLGVLFMWDYQLRNDENQKVKQIIYNNKISKKLK